MTDDLSGSITEEKHNPLFLSSVTDDSLDTITECKHNPLSFYSITDDLPDSITKQKHNLLPITDSKHIKAESILFLNNPIIYDIALLITDYLDKDEDSINYLTYTDTPLEKYTC